MQTTNTATQSASAMLDALILTMHLKNDAALSRALEVAPPVISKVRNETLPIGPSFLIKAHEASGISIAALKDLAGLPRITSKVSAP